MLYLQSLNLICVASCNEIYSAINKCGTDEANAENDCENCVTNMYNILRDSQSDYQWEKCTQHPYRDHHSNNTLVSYKLLVSEVKMNCQESVDTDGHNTKKRRVNKQRSNDVKRSGGEISRIDHPGDVERLNQ